MHKQAVDVPGRVDDTAGGGGRYRADKGRGDTRGGDGKVRIARQMKKTS